MADVTVLSIIDELCKKIHMNDLRFGAVMVLFAGDLRQLSLVYTDSHPFPFDTCLFGRSSYYENSVKFALTENMRALGSPEYVSFIQAVGDGLNNISLCPFESVMISQDNIYL
ncbi:hypothetical protein CDIK_4183 [Cucumispora dikerogammari]|nr:hypothetical protein CDIK_4183 [Cucumispora dikerogammari]